MAQSVPGSAECPIIDRIVTCSGNLASGVRVVAGADRDGLTVQNITTDISVSTRPAIEFTAGTATTRIRLIDPDNALRVSTTSPAASGRDTNLSAVLATATNNTTFSLSSDIDIFGRTICPFTSCLGRRALVASGIVVRGAGGSFALENLGDITINNDESFTFTRGAAIVADIFGADLVTIRNAGVLTVRNGGGIVATADNRRIEITNDGSIVTSEDDDADSSTDGGISLQFDSFKAYADSFTRPDVPLLTDFSYRIVNNGTIQTATANEFGFNPGIIVSNVYSEFSGGGSSQFFAGRQIGEIVNNGTITGYGGIYVEQNGDLTITNNGRIEAGFGIISQQFLPDFGPIGGPALTRVVNGAAGIITVVDTVFGTTSGVSFDGAIVEFSNAGRINVTGESSAGVYLFGASASLSRRPLQLATFANTGEILVSGTNANGFAIIRSHPITSVRAPDQRTVLTNSGTIAATGVGANGLYFDHRTASADASLAGIGLLDIDLAASSVVRGGSGTGAGIRIIAGERHNLRNAGLITATSGIAIVGGTGIETIDNAGRIEGSVSLGAGDDRLIMRAGSLITGAVDGGAGSDTIAFDVASGVAAFGDRAPGSFTGFELLEKTGAGTLTLSSVAAARVALTGGALRTTGDLGALRVDAASGTTLEASGTLGAVTIADGATLSAGGTTVGSATFASLGLSGSSIVRFDLGAPNVVGGASNDLITVTGNLVLDGSLHVVAGFGFGNGVYRLFNYGGTLTDNGLALGQRPDADYVVQTAVAGQVNLVVSNFVDVLFWDDGDSVADGLVDGGNGTWNAANTNWTNANGSSNRAWSNSFAVFQGAAGTVTVEGAQTVRGLQFVTSGYRLIAGTGGALTLGDAETVIRVDPNASAELALPLGGAGALVKRDLGTLILGGANTYTGGTIVREGVVQAAADTAFGTGGLTLDGGTVRAGGAFTLARGVTIGAGNGTIDTGTNALTMSGALTGAGSLTKIGTGTLTYGGNGGGFTGITRINAGSFSLGGSLGGQVIVAPGATLSGAGSAAGLDLAGIVAPGNSPGTLSFTGDAVFRSGSIYRAELVATGASDRINVGGRATIEGGSVAITALDPDLSYTDGAIYRILSATGGLTGRFTALSESSAFLDFALGYDPTGVFVTVDVVRVFPDVAATFNQKQASIALAAFAQTAGSDSLAIYNALLLSDAGPARAAFDLSSGEIYAAMLASSLRQGEELSARLLTRAHVSGGEGWSLWGGVHGLDGRIDGDGNGDNVTRDGAGGWLGFDYRGPGNRWAAGFGIGYQAEDVVLSTRASSADGSGWHTGAYARYGTNGEGLTLGASAAYASSETEVSRIVAIGALRRTARSDVDTEASAFAIEVRYGFAAGSGWAVGPTAFAAASTADLGQFAETGADSLNLTGVGDDDRTRYGAGVFVHWDGAQGSFDATISYGAGGGDPSEIGLAMTGAATTPYRVRSPGGGEDTVAFSLSGETEFEGGWSLGASVYGNTNADEYGLAGNIVVGLKF